MLNKIPVVSQGQLVGFAAVTLFLVYFFVSSNQPSPPTDTEFVITPAFLAGDEQWHHRSDLPQCASSNSSGSYQELGGQWLANTAKIPYTYKCPLMLKTFACAEFDKAGAAVVSRRSFYPYNCHLRKFNANNFLKSCSLWSGHGSSTKGRPRMQYTTDRTVPAADFPESSPPQGAPGLKEKTSSDSPLFNAQAVCVKNSWFGDRCPYRTASVYFPDNGMLNLELMRLEQFEESTWTQIVQHYGTHDTDVLVFNVGLFYLRDMDRFKADMEAFFIRLLNASYPGLVFLREHSPAHFPKSPDGSYQGQVKESCQPIAGKGNRQYWNIVVDLLQRCQNGEFNGGKQPSRCANFFLLPVFGAAYSQWDAHFGMFAERPWARNVTDCQHWCNPSAPIDMWSQLLYNVACPA